MRYFGVFLNYTIFSNLTCYESLIFQRQLYSFTKKVVYQWTILHQFLIEMKKKAGNISYSWKHKWILTPLKKKDSEGTFLERERLLSATISKYKCGFCVFDAYRKALESLGSFHSLPIKLLQPYNTCPFSYFLECFFLYSAYFCFHSPLLTFFISIITKICS